MAVRDYPVQPGRSERGYVIQRTTRVDEYMLVRDCPMCGGEARVRIPAQGLWDWEHGAFVQTAFPGLSADQREMVMSGTHPKCWDLMMGEDE